MVYRHTCRQAKQEKNHIPKIKIKKSQDKNFILFRDQVSPLAQSVLELVEITLTQLQERAGITGVSFQAWLKFCRHFVSEGGMSALG